MSELVQPQLPVGSCDIAIAGDAPDAEDTRLHKPFQGKVGRLLDKCLGAAGILRPFLYIDNVLRFQPAGNQFKSVPKEIVAAEGLRLREDLRRIAPKVVVSLGFQPLRALYPNYPADLMRVRGLPIQHPDGYTLIPTLHPAFLMRGEIGQLPLLIHDLKKAKRFSVGGAQQPERRLLLISNGKDDLAHGFPLALAGVVAFDIETTRRQQLLCVGFADSDTQATVIWLDKSTLNPAMYERNLKLAKSIMADHGLRKIGQNICRFDLPLLKREGFELNNVMCDTMVLWHACFPLWRKGLPNLASYYTDEPYWKTILGSFAGEDGDKMVWDGTMSAELAEMNGRDNCITYECWTKLRETAKQLGVERIAAHDMECAELAREMTENGIAVSKERIKAEATRREAEIVAAADRLNAAARAAGWIGEVKVTKRGVTKPTPPFNCKSTKQVRAFITEILHLQLPKNRAGKVTSDAMTLLEMARTKQQPLLRDIVLLSKKRTRASFFKLKLHKGRIHAGINVCATKSGRWGGEKSLLGGRSLQNIPHDSRHIFVADPGMWCVQVDKRQAEATITANKMFVETGDSTYKDLIARVDKTHLFLGRELCKRGVFKIDPEKFSAENEVEYLVAKRGVHGFSYGLGPLSFTRKLAKDTDGEVVLPVAVAKQVQQVWYQASHIPRWQKATLDWVKANVELENPFGRKIWIYTVKHVEGVTGENLPLAWYPQSTSVDHLDEGLISLSKSKLPFKPVMQCHDSIWYLVPKIDYCPELMKVAEAHYSHPFTISSYNRERHVEVVVSNEWKIGEDFGNMEEIKINATL